MEAVYGWVKNIIYYMIFLSVVNNLLADSKYGKYIRFFAGMVLILLVVGPFTGSLRLDEQMSAMFRSFSFQNDTDDLKKDLWGMEERRLEQVMGQYEEAVADDVTAMARSEGLACSGARVVINGDRDSSGYGQIRQIQLILEGADGESGKMERDYLGSRPVNVDAGRIDSVEISEVELGGTETAGNQADTEEAPESAQALSSSVQGKINHLTGKVAQYYGLEKGNIQIQWKDD